MNCQFALILEFLSNSNFATATVSEEEYRVNKVQEYIYRHYNEEIRLSQLAGLIGMSYVAFSRFFKLRTSKNVSEYIIDVRLGQAARLLADSGRSIAEICYSCGFNNLSNFNRIFLKKIKCTPKTFRDNYRKTKIII